MSPKATITAKIAPTAIPAICPVISALGVGVGVGGGVGVGFATETEKSHYKLNK